MKISQIYRKKTFEACKTSKALFTSFLRIQRLPRAPLFRVIRVISGQPSSVSKTIEVLKTSKVRFPLFLRIQRLLRAQICVSKPSVLICENHFFICVQKNTILIKISALRTSDPIIHRFSTKITGLRS